MSAARSTVPAMGEGGRPQRGETVSETKLPSRRWGPFRQEFYSLHSGPPCDQSVDGVCPHGVWLSVLVHRLSSVVYWASPRLWRWWGNL